MKSLIVILVCIAIASICTLIERKKESAATDSNKNIK